MPSVADSVGAPLASWLGSAWLAPWTSAWPAGWFDWVGWLACPSWLVIGLAGLALAGLAWVGCLALAGLDRLLSNLGGWLGQLRLASLLAG